MSDISELKELLRQPKDIVITMHQNPDADAIGSALGLYMYLIKKGHTVTVISPTDYPKFLKWMPGNEKVLQFLRNREQSTDLIKNAAFIFCLDFNRIERIYDMGDLIKGSSAKKILIDHHLDPDNFEDFRLWDNKASSTAELIYDFISIMGDSDQIDVDIAECIYAGIMTDTGSFRYEATSAKVHSIVSDLLKIGVSPDKIHQLIFDSFTEDRLRFFGYCISEKMKILPDYRVGYISVTSDELKRFNHKIGDSEGLVNYPLMLSHIDMAALIIERTEPGDKTPLIKLSLRSKGTIPVNELASNYFNGGGHRNAAGGISNKSLEETVKIFEDSLKDWAPLKK